MPCYYRAFYSILDILLFKAGQLQYSCLENPMDTGVWQAAVYGVSKSRTQLSDFTFSFHFHALEKEMVTHSSVLAWRIPGTEEPGGAAVYGVAQSRTRLKRLSRSSSSIQNIKMYIFTYKYVLTYKICYVKYNIVHILYVYKLYI